MASTSTIASGSGSADTWTQLLAGRPFLKYSTYARFMSTNMAMSVTNTVVFSTLYSTWLGIGSARLLDNENGKALAAGMMIGAPAGLLTSLALTRNAKLTD